MPENHSPGIPIPATGDHSGSEAWGTLGLASLVGMSALVLTLHRSNGV